MAPNPSFCCHSQAQYLDKLKVEQERGITVKASVAGTSMEGEMAIVPVIDTTMAQAQARAKEYIARTNAKPLSNETEDAYSYMLLALRTLCSREMTIDKHEAAGGETIAIPQRR